MSATVKLKYVGAHLAVELERPDGSVVEVERGGVFETDEEHATRLLEQTLNWKLAVKPARSAKAEKDGD